MFSDVRARLGAARLHLHDLQGSASHAAHSQLQANAIVALIKRSLQNLDADEKASLSTLAINGNFCECDLAKITKCLSSASQRRPSQDFTAFLAYLSQDQWDVVLNASNDDMILDEFLYVLVSHLNCVNASEWTLRRLASAVIAASRRLHTPQAKSAKAQLVKKAYRKLVRTIKAGKESWDLPYLVKLPSDPVRLQLECPTLYARAVARGELVPCPLNNLPEVEATCMNLRESLRDVAIAEPEFDSDG